MDFVAIILTSSISSLITLTSFGISKYIRYRQEYKNEFEHFYNGIKLLKPIPFTYNHYLDYKLRRTRAMCLLKSNTKYAKYIKMIKKRLNLL